MTRKGEWSPLLLGTIVVLVLLVLLLLFWRGQGERMADFVRGLFKISGG